MGHKKRHHKRRRSSSSTSTETYIKRLHKPPDAPVVLPPLPVDPPAAPVDPTAAADWASASAAQYPPATGLPSKTPPALWDAGDPPAAPPARVIPGVIPPATRPAAALISEISRTVQPVRDLPCSHAGSIIRSPMREKTWDVEGRFAVSLEAEKLIEYMPGVPLHFDQDAFFVDLAETRGFLAMAPKWCTPTLWTGLLHEAFPEFVAAEVPLESMIVLLVMRARLAATQANRVMLDFVEFWAGSGISTMECIRRMMHCCRLDRKYSNSQNCSTSNGLRLWLDVLCCIRQGGSVWFGTQCSSFLNLTRFHSKRRHDNGYVGDEGRTFVKEGNRQMAVTSLLVLLAHLLGVHFVLEQPLQSVLPLIEPLRSALDFTRATRATTWLGAFGGTSPKPLQIWYSCGKFKSLARPRPLSDFPTKLVIQLGDKRFRGHRRMLKESEVYPQEFAAAVASILAQT